MLLQPEDPDHDGELGDGGEAGAEGEDPPEEVTVPDVEDEVGHGYGGRGVKSDGEQRLDWGEHGQASQEPDLKRKRSQVLLSMIQGPKRTVYHFNCEKCDSNTQSSCELSVLALELELGVVQGETGEDVILSGHQHGGGQHEVGEEDEEPGGHEAPHMQHGQMVTPVFTSASGLRIGGMRPGPGTLMYCYLPRKAPSPLSSQSARSIYT